MMMMVLVLVSLLEFQSTLSSPAPLPTLCDREVEETGDCHYGTTYDRCGNRVCMKGPGEVCGGKYGRYGTCGDGLMCSNCNRCQGCSYQTFSCWSDTNCLSW
ncbi:neuroparsin-A [Eurytemora carolleeae]|uniref:neuroparsin-A n=1 Tax=Eurytemora carolleeae TaxID=1294199 RepID=UPI000C783198|nr:neuroparsin-A [Eurytemora carolleeae]|eukprot:XP_023340265.1 neuroparsin-A-like [Eurytemora affinis]